MYICLCKSLTEADIHNGVLEGEVRCFDSLQVKLGASTGCGCCEEVARECLDEALARKRLVDGVRERHCEDEQRDLSPAGPEPAAGQPLSTGANSG